MVTEIGRGTRLLLSKVLTPFYTRFGTMFARRTANGSLASRGLDMASLQRTLRSSGNLPTRPVVSPAADDRQALADELELIARSPGLAMRRRRLSRCI
jgi:hypothetical protein